MTSPHYKRLKIISFTLAGVEYSAQITSWKLATGDKIGNRIYTYNIAGEGSNSVIEETDGEPSLDIKFLADWRVGGISDYLAANHNTIVAYTLDHHPDIVGEHIQFGGQIQIKMPETGDQARADEVQETTMPILGPVPTLTRM